MTHLPSFLRVRKLAMAAFVVALATAGAVAAPAGAQTVDEIKKKGTLTVGMLVDIPPFGITNTNNQPDGYDADVAKLMAKHMGVNLDIVPVTGPNRIPYLLTNKVDLLVATLGVTPERAKQVQFSDPYSNLDIGVYAPKDKQIKTAEDLKSLRIAVARASTQDAALTAAAPKGTRIMRFDDDASALQALISGQVDALGANNMVAEQIKSMAPSSDYEMKFLLNRQYNAIALRKGQDDLLKWVNGILDEVKKNGELNEIYKKWFHTELPEMPKS
jgi:polar amino acid transport system substrate-binding protein